MDWHTGDLWLIYGPKHGSYLAMAWKTISATTVIIERITLCQIILSLVFRKCDESSDQNTIINSWYGKAALDAIAYLYSKEINYDWHEW